MIQRKMDHLGTADRHLLMAASGAGAGVWTPRWWPGCWVGRRQDVEERLEVLDAASTSWSDLSESKRFLMGR